MSHWVRLRLSDFPSRFREIALRREEAARKRKHLSEKKLEDEKVHHFSFLQRLRPSLPDARAFFIINKAETINRLLKKSGTRDSRNPLASAEDHTPPTHTGNGTPTEAELYEEENGETAAAVAVAAAGTAARVAKVIPTRCRWISTL